MILRPRQIEFVDRAAKAVAEHGNTLGVAPTGFGKTVVLSALTGKLMSETDIGGALILQHRDELVSQNRRTYHAVNGMQFNTGVINSEKKQWSRPVAFGMVQTVVRNLDRLPGYGLVMIDEAHHIAAQSYQNIIDANNDARQRAGLGPAKLVGLTATPNRGDKKGLICSFNNVCDQVTLGELVRGGFLVRPRTFVIDLGVTDELKKVRKTANDYDQEEVAKIMDTAVLNEQVVRHWREHASQRQTAVFCSTVEHAYNVKKAFLEAGVTAEVVHGAMGKNERRKMIRAYDTARFQVIINCMVLTEGWDHQPTDCIVLLRLASYKSTMIQMIGRGLRRVDPERYPGRIKQDCIVLDFGTSVINHGDIEQDVDLWQKKGEMPMKKCRACGALIPLGVTTCPICGFENKIAPSELEGLGIELPKAPNEFMLTEIDILEASPFKWEPLFNGVVRMACAFDAWAAVLSYGAHYVAVGGGKELGMAGILVGDEMLCLSAADDFLRAHGDRTAARKSQQWLTMRATDKQVQYLGPWAHAITRYEAACHLTWKFNQKSIEAKVGDMLK